MHKLSLTHPETLVIRKHILEMNQTKPTSRQVKQKHIKTTTIKVRITSIKK